MALALAACSEPVGLDGPCTADSDCEGSLRCVGFGEDQRCRKLGSDGDPCWSTDSNGCAGGFVCSQGTCIRPHTRRENDLCSYNVDCGDETVCSWALKPHVCKPAAGVNESCGHPTDCASGLECPEVLFGGRVCECPVCPGSQICSTHGCIEPHTVEVAQRCEHNADCEGALVCEWAVKPHVCVPARQQGETCGHPTDCASGLTCDSGGLCRATCTSAAECGGGEVCISPGLCAQPVGEGEVCSEDLGCAAGLWCGSGRCKPKLPAGSDCPMLRFDGGAFKDGSTICQASLSCVMACESDGSRGTCQKRLPKGASCAACNKDGACTSAGEGWCNGGCEIGLVCADSVCSAP